MSGVQAQTQTVWKQVCKQNIPSIAFINKMDRDGANFYRSLESIHKKLGANAIPIQIPICIGNEDSFIGVVDLISMRKFIWSSSSSSQSVSSSPSSSRIALPPIITTLSLNGKGNDDDDDRNYNELYHQALKQRHVLFEALADADEIFMELYLQSNETDYSPDSVSSSSNYNDDDGDGDDDTDHSNVKKITTKDILSALRRCCLTNTIVPTLCGASLRCKGIEPLLDSILTFLPNPLEIKPLQAIHTNESSSSSSMKSSSSISSTKPSVSSSTATALKSIHPITDKDLCALAFKVTHDALRGPLVYVRVFSGSISSKQTLYNSTKGELYAVVMMMVTINMNMIL